jgi:hypothetical protein
VKDVQGVELAVYRQGGLPVKVCSSLAPGECFSGRVFHPGIVLHTGLGWVAWAHHNKGDAHDQDQSERDEDERSSFHKISFFSQQFVRENR